MVADCWPGNGEPMELAMLSIDFDTIFTVETFLVSFVFDVCSVEYIADRFEDMDDRLNVTIFCDE